MIQLSQNNRIRAARFRILLNKNEALTSINLSWLGDRDSPPEAGAPLGVEHE